MAKIRRIHIPGENRLLTALSKDDRDRLLPHLEKVSLTLRDILYEANGPIEHVYFPLAGVVSLVIMDGRFTLEVGVIGNEGLVGTPVFLGAERSPTRAIVQIPGEALRLEVKVFQKEMRRDGPLYGLVQRYTQAMINQISQSIVCNHRHSVEKRMCRWLMMSHNRAGGERVPAHSGVPGPDAWRVPPHRDRGGGAHFRKAGLIHYHRGRITVIDRQGLEATSCECYEAVAKELDRLLG